jgi:hypothetical protein
MFTALLSCKEDKTSDEPSDEIIITDIYHYWSVISLHMVDSIHPMVPPEGNILLAFSKDMDFGVKLEVNNCGGTFNIMENDRMEISIGPCTLACCDSEFSSILLNILPAVNKFRIEESNLFLLSEIGSIKLDFEQFID